MRRRIIFLAVMLVLQLVPAPGRGDSGARGAGLWQGKVVLDRDVIVEAGATLEIAAGTQIRILRPDLRFEVRGVIQVLGTAQRPVVVSAPKDWGGLQLVEGAAGSRFEHIRISGVRTALSATGTHFILRSSSFQDCEIALKLMRKSDPQISDCTFENNEIAIDSELRSSPSIRNNRFVGQSKAAILSAHSSAGVIEGNVFENNRIGIKLLRAYSGGIAHNRFASNGVAISCNQTQQTPNIIGNHFENNGKGLEVFSYSAPLVENNRFLRNGTAIANRQMGSPRVFNNRFTGNDVALSNIKKSQPRIEKNLLSGNRIALFCDYSSYPRVKRNNFLDNRLAVRLGEFQSAELEVRVGNRAAAVQAGMFGQVAGQSRPDRPALPRPEAVVDVSENWWGPKTAHLAAAGKEGNLPFFFDQLDQAEHPRSRPVLEGYNLDRVRYHPWLTAAVADAGPR